MGGNVFLPLQNSACRLSGYFCDSVWGSLANFAILQMDGIFGLFVIKNLQKMWEKFCGRVVIRKSHWGIDGGSPSKRTTYQYVSWVYEYWSHFSSETSDRSESSRICVLYHVLSTWNIVNIGCQNVLRLIISLKMVVPPCWKWCYISKLSEPY